MNTKDSQNLLLQGKKCLVTGGSRGIGLAIVELFLANGASVEYYSRSRAERHEELEAKAKEHGQELLHTSINVANGPALEAAIEKSVANMPFDVVVNNAGITKDNLLFRMSLEDFRAVIDANLNSAFLVSKAAARIMIKRRSGSIINISSVVGLSGNGGQANYSASKAGLIGLTKSMAKEVASRGVRVNAIAPGFINSSMTESLGEEARNKLLAQIPLNRAGNPEEVAKAVLFLASDLSSYVTGEVLRVDGGMAM